MLKKISQNIKYHFFQILILQSFAQGFALEANSQTISDKSFTKPNHLIVTTSGFVNFSAIERNQTTAFEQNNLPDGFTNNTRQNNKIIENNSQLYLKAGAISNANMKYGAILKLESEISSDAKNGVVNLDEGFVYTESAFGKFEFGNNLAVNQKMKVGPASFARGNGGINGNYLKYVNLPMLANSSIGGSSACVGGVGDSTCSNVKLPHFILAAQSPIGHGGYAQSFYLGSVDNNYSNSQNSYSAFNRNRTKTFRDGSLNGAEDALKINYYTPRINGLQVGLSYTHDTTNNGISSTIYNYDGIRIVDVISVGANYSDNIDNLGYAISATAEKGKFKKTNSVSAINRNNLFSYDIASSISYFGFTLGASYGSWGKSLQPKDGIYSCDYNSSQSLASQNCSSNLKKYNNSDYRTLGIAYQFGPLGMSVTNLTSKFQKNEYQATALDIDYKYKKGLMPYFEVTKFQFKSNQVQASDVSSNQTQIKNNKGFVAIIGILFSF